MTRESRSPQILSYGCPSKLGLVYIIHVNPLRPVEVNNTHNLTSDWSDTPPQKFGDWKGVQMRVQLEKCGLDGDVMARLYVACSRPYKNGGMSNPDTGNSSNDRL